MTFEQVHNNRDVLLLQCISGSKAYGLDTPESDTDIKGVFSLGKREFYGLHYTEQVSNAKSDFTYYELKRFMELLLSNNPNIMELLGTPPDKVLYRHPVMDMIRPEMFLSRLCFQTYAKYAQDQMKKSKGLKKRIFNPVDRERKGVLDFCFVVEGYASVPLRDWLERKGYAQEECGLVNIAHFREIYALFHQSKTGTILRGICSGESAEAILLSSVPQGVEPEAIISFSKDSYSIYCKEYAQYWAWVENRNEARFRNTLAHGKNYDSKNMMHTFRLLNMAEEIAVEKRVNVFRKDREFLLKIRSGGFLYDDLVNIVQEKIAKIEELYAVSDLPDHPDEAMAEDLLVKMREMYFGARS